MTVLLCLVRPGDLNEELRYAARSWEANLALPDLELWTVGYKPTWLKPERHIEGNFYDSAPLAVFDNVRLGMEAAIDAGLSEIVLMNDDFFCMDPVGSLLPVRRNKNLVQHIAIQPAGLSHWWPTSLRLTLEWLVSEGFPDPESWEVHRPLLVDPAVMLKAQQRWLDTGPNAMTGPVPQFRTIYGAFSGIEAWPVADAKLGSRGANVGVGTPWLSTSDQSWRRYAPSIKKRFQKPSRWEV